MIVIQNRRIRNVLRVCIPVFLIPFVVFGGSVLFGEKQYLFVSLVTAFLAVWLFIAGFEKKETGTRRMVIIAVMTALSVVGRFIPFLKPITAITVLAGVWLQGESGFLVGALSALLSNFYFGQGPWTPFQMLAWGMIGLLAGVLARPLRCRRAWLLLYGVFSGIFYSLVMDIWTVFSYDGGFSWQLYGAAVLTAVPHTCLYAVSNFLFLFWMAKPFGEKLQRIQIKYGI